MLQCANAITQRLKEAENALAQLKGVTGGRLDVAVISAGDYFFPRVLAAFGASHPGRHLQPHGAQPRGPAAAARRQSHRSGGDGASAARHGHRRAAVRAASVRDRGAARPPACRRAPDPARGAQPRALRAARAGIGHLELDARGVRAAVLAPQHRHADPQHRDHQAGGGRRHGYRVPVGTHHRTRPARRQPRGARRAGISRDAQLVPGAQPQQAAATGGASPSRSSCCAKVRRSSSAWCTSSCMPRGGPRPVPRAATGRQPRRAPAASRESRSSARRARQDRACAAG